MKYLTPLKPLVRCLSLLLLILPQLAEAKGAYQPEFKDAQAEVYKSVNGVDLQLWIINPEGHSVDEKKAAIVFFFGGGWYGGNPQQFNSQARYLANRGMVAIIADYRVRSRNDVPAKKCVEDAKSAMRWVRSHAEELGIDPDRIAAGGGSAGGHLAAATATLPGHNDPGDDASTDCQPNALVLFNPVIIVGSAEGYRELDEEGLRKLRWKLGTEPESMSPYHHIREGLPPTIIFHGSEDNTVPFSSVEMYTKQAVALGNRCELTGYEGLGHGFFNPGRHQNRPFADTLSRTDAFLVSLGFLDPKE